MMSRFVALVIFAGMFLPLSACKTWYKPGADDESLGADQQRCEDEAGESAGDLYRTCLKRAGWHYRDTSVTSDSPGQGDSIEVEAAVPSAQYERTPAIDTLSTVEAGSAGGARKAGSPQAGRWVQLGAGTEQLEVAKGRCDEAGAGSEAYNECMRGKGWRPIRFRITVEEPGELD